MTYPATNSKEASELLIDVSNQMHEIVNEDATTEVMTESGLVPSVRKALADTFLFQDPIAWNQGSDETAFNQLRTFNDNIYWAPTATTLNPIPMGATPIGDSNWKLAPVDVSREWTLQELTRSQNEVIGGKIFPSDDSVLQNGDNVPVGTTHLRVNIGGEPTIVAISPAESGIVSLLTEEDATIGGTSTSFIKIPQGSRGEIKTSQLPSYPSEQSVEDAINLAINNGFGKVIVDGLVYSTTKSMTFSGASNLKVLFESSVVTITSDDHFIDFQSSKNVKIEGDCSELIGQVTPQWAKDNVITEVKPFFKFTNSKFCKSFGFLGTAVRTIAASYNSDFCELSGNHVDGGLTEDATTSNGLLYGWNYMPCCFVSGGFGNTLNNSAENHGSVALCGSDTKSIINLNNKGKNLHDNNVYVSSASHAVSIGNTSSDVAGSNVKTRGTANVTAANSGENANVSVETSGNGLIADSQGANGSANLSALNVAVKSRSHDFRLIKQDGLPLRHSLVALNASDGHQGLGDFTPLVVAAQKSCGIFGNVVGGTAANKVLNVTGVDSSSYGNGHLVALNIMRGDNYASNFNDNDDLIYALNQEDTANGSEVRFIDYALFFGNMHKNGNSILASNTYPSSNVLVAYNFGAQAISAGQTNILAEGNFNNNYNYPAGVAPFKAGIMSWTNNDVYFSVPNGVGGFEFKQLQEVTP